MKNLICAITFFLAPFAYGLAQVNTPETINGGPSEACAILINNCGDEIIEFAKSFVPPTDPDCKLWKGSCDTEGEIWRNGTVSIGTVSTVSHTNWFAPKLTVEGGITSEQLQICQVGWCDYVFDDTFRLLPLKSVAAYIRDNKHLPGCTPGPVLESMHGFFVDEQTVQQQQKIEEAFLHLIQTGERIDALSARYAKGNNTGLPFPHVASGPEAAETPGPPLVMVVCSVIKAASGLSTPDGIAGVTISGAMPPFTITWPGGQLQNVRCDGVVRIPNLLPGTYTFTVRDAQGVIIGSCTTTIGVNPNSPCDVLEEEACKEAILDLLKDAFAKEVSTCKQWEGGDCDKDGLIYRTGNVAIGTSIGKSGYSLAVGGGILTDNFKIQLCSGAWCDYVFEPEYPLMPLQEVKTHLEKHKSLPGMVTQAEINREGGYELKTVKLDQQEKIEEAFLHLIQLKKKINQLNQSLNNLN